MPRINPSIQSDINLQAAQLSKMLALRAEAQQLLYEIGIGPAIMTSLHASHKTGRLFTLPLILRPLHELAEKEPKLHLLSLSVQIILLMLHFSAVSFLYKKIQNNFASIFPNGLSLNRNPNLAFTQATKVLSEIENIDLEDTNKGLTQYINTLQRAKRQPIYLLLILIPLLYIFNILFFGEKNDNGTTQVNSEILSFARTLILYLQVSLFGFLIVWLLQSARSTYSNWNSPRLYELLLAEFNADLHPHKAPWQITTHAGNAKTAILYTHFDKDKVTLELSEKQKLEVPASAYFKELAAVLREAEVKVMTITENGLFIPLDTVKLLASTLQEKLLARLQKRAEQKANNLAILQQLNAFNVRQKLKSEWEMAEEDNDTLFYLDNTLFPFPANFLATLSNSYPAMEIINRRGNYQTVILRNPQLINFTQVTSSATTQNINQNDSSRVVTTLHQRPSTTTPAPATPRVSTNTGAPRAATTQVYFPRYGLSFDRTNYNEATSPIRPINAAWLPEDCHFSYLTPHLANHLPDGLDIEAINNILKVGKAYGMGKTKSKSAGVGIVQSDETYTNITGSACLASYKLKIGQYRLHGRLVETDATNRHRLFCFDGIRLGHPGRA